MDEELKVILREAFGDSSSDTHCESSDDRFDDCTNEISNTRIWQPIVGINGLWICRLSTNNRLCYLVLKEAMRFGDLPSWATELSLYFRENVPVRGHIPESPSHLGSEENCL